MPTRIHGRLIAYGEYLMHDDAYGLILKSSLFLATPDDPSAPEHATYRPALDRVAARLTAEGRVPLPSVRGSLPFGCGFASSTVLCYLHLKDETDEIKRRTSLRVDRSLHGFEPSGVDSAYASAQRRGLYSRHCWEEITDVAVPCSALIVAPEKKLDLAEILERVRRRKHELVPLADSMSAAIRARGVLPYEVLLEYARILVRTGVYSRAAQDICELGLKHGVAVKGTGGLYDKALIIFWPPDAEIGAREDLRRHFQVPGGTWIEDA